MFRTRLGPCFVKDFCSNEAEASSGSSGDIADAAVLAPICHNVYEKLPMAKKESNDVLTMVEWLLLASILKNDNDAYGAVIYETATELATPTRVAYGSLYPTLERLERNGLLESRTSEPIKERGGRSRRYFAVTANGQKAMHQAESFAERVTRSRKVAWGL
jgi:PadR family transcriptional regulator PadR